LPLLSSQKEFNHNSRACKIAICIDAMCINHPCAQGINDAAIHWK